MAFHRGPKIVRDRLVFYYDIDNNRSYVGEPTTNLLFNSGAINLSTANDIYGKCIKTSLGGGMYKFVNNGTGISTVRLYVNLADIGNGLTYACSIYYKDLTLGNISIDWCDTSVTSGINSSNLIENRLYGLGTRATYDSTFRFLDINFDSGASVILYNPQIEYKTRATPFVEGIRSVYQGLYSLVNKNRLTTNLTPTVFDSNGKISLNGSSYISIVYSTLFDFSDAQTIVMWMKPGTGAPTQRRNPYNQAFGGSGTLTHEGDGTINYYFGTNGGDNNPYVGINSTFTVAQNETAFIVVTRSQSLNICRWYKNGVLYTDTNAGGYLATNNGSSYIQIGSGYTGQGFIGNIYTTAVYNKFFTTAEVLQNFNATKTRFGM
jgi:hypothetical protein